MSFLSDLRKKVRKVVYWVPQVFRLSVYFVGIVCVVTVYTAYVMVLTAVKTIIIIMLVWMLVAAVEQWRRGGE
jgi:hypothetical protein